MKQNTKKTRLIVIIVIIIFLLTIATILIMNKNNSNNNQVVGSNNEKTNNKTSADSIQQIEINDSNVVALNSKGELYAVGRNLYEKFGLGDEGPEELDKPTKIASNVQKFLSDESICYINNNNDLFTAGLSYTGGVNKNFEKIYSNVKDIFNYGPFCIIAIDNNNESYYYKNSFADKYCALDETTEFTEFANDVKYAVLGNDYNGYVNSKGQLYMRKSGENEYTKILDNVKNYEPKAMGLSTHFILTDDNTLYMYNLDNDHKLHKINENVIEIGSNYYKTEEGKYYGFIDNDYSYDSIKQLIITDEESSFALLNIDDIKQLLFYSPYYSNEGRFIYINTDDKLVLLSKDEEKVIDYNIESMKEIYNFVKY